MLKIPGNDDSIRLMAEENTPFLRIISENQHGKIADFNLNLISLDEESYKQAETNYDVEISMESAEFSRICRELAVISDDLTIKVSKDKVIFEVSGDAGQGSICCLHGSPISKDAVQVSCRDNFEGSFALRYINQFNKAAVLAEKVIINISADIPISIKYPFILGQIRYYLAPKMPDI